MSVRHVLTGLLVSIAVSSGTHAAMVTLTPDSFIHVSLDGDRDGVGTVDAGAVGDNTYFVRERADAQPGLRIALFLDFDLSSQPIASVTSASFGAQFTDRLNTVNNMSVNVGRVQDDGVNGDTWDTSLAADTVPLFEWGLNSADDVTLMNNVQTATIPTDFSVDVTAIIQDLVAGNFADNGLVLFSPTAVFQGAGFEDIELVLTFVPVPEPSALALIWLSLLSLGFVGWRSRRR